MPLTEMKTVVGLWLKSKGWNVNFEAHDIVAEKDFKMVVRIQCNKISFEEIIRRTLIDKRNGFRTLWFFDGYGFNKLVSFLESEGFKGYILDIDATPPKVCLEGKDEVLMNLSPTGYVNNFVVLSQDSTIVDVDFCPSCYYSGEMVEVFEWDMVSQSPLSKKMMCPICGFEQM